MLAPDDRHLFLQALRPPDGYKFDHGIGTTFSLDLYSLLVAPLSLAFLEFENPEQALRDPLWLLESLRRYSGRLTIFCQAGQIQVPARHNLLLSHLEGMVLEARAPRGGAFHPKFWLLRYTAPDSQPLYRLLNLTRNLTFDRCWDLMVSLEGEVADRKKAFGRNRPITDFLHALPGLVRNNIREETAECLKVFQSEVGRVEFEIPEGFDNIRFHPLGISGHLGNPFPRRADRHLIISPFLSDTFLKERVQTGEQHVLISRLESVDELNRKTRKSFEQVLVLEDQIEPEISESNEISTEASTTVERSVESVELTGLHAKLYIWEHGWDADWLIGSANATTAAFHHNVEFMIGLMGKKSRIGIDAILHGKSGRASFMNILRAYPEPDARSKPDPDQKAAEALAEKVRKWLISSEPFLSIDSSAAQEYEVDLGFKVQLKAEPGNYTIRCWPITVDAGLGQFVFQDRRTSPVHFSKIGLTSLTSFVAFEIRITHKAHQHLVQFVINLPVVGMPAERDDSILSAMLSDRSQFLRYIQMLLLDASTNLESGFAEAALRLGSNLPNTGRWDQPLLEKLVLALSRSNFPGGQIDQIQDLVARLKRSPRGQLVIPPEFDLFWEKILLAREKLL
jgi:hypothetical protein